MNLKPILALSLVVNLALAGAFAWSYGKRKPTTAEMVAAPVATPAPAAKQDKPESPEPVTAAAEPAKPAQSFDWRMVESADYKKYIANLRSIGCPEETIRDIILADVNKLFEARRKEQASGGKKFEYWKAGNPFAGMMDGDRLEKQQKLAQEKRELLKELLGVVPEEKFDMFAGIFDSMLDFLPSEKQNKVMQLFQDMQVKVAKQMKGGAADAEDMKGYQKAQKDMEAELAKILSPQEFEDFQLRMSQTATAMRSQLAGFDPSEDEFRKVFFEKKKFDDEFSMFTAGTEDKEEKAKREQAKKDLDERLKQALGEDRYKDYERAQDWNYQAVAKLAERNSLGKDVANKIYDMKKLAEDEANKVRMDKSLTAEQRTAALQGIRSETENSIKPMFGDKDKAYKSFQGQAYWLKSIAPDKAPPKE